MSVEMVTATAANALNGLYLTPDLHFCAVNVTPNELIWAADEFHEKQPHTEDFDTFANDVNDAYHVWTGSDKAPLKRYPRLAELAMATADLASTYKQITRGMCAAVDAVLSVHFQSTNVADDADYRRVIPPGLRTMRLEHKRNINIETFLRVFAVDPWQSWLERLRAQKQRTVLHLSSDHVCEALVKGTEKLVDTTCREHSDLLRIKKNKQEIEAARKSIRKSIKMFERLNCVDDLRQFLGSRANPLRPLVIEGKTYDYRLYMRSGSLLQTTINCNTKVAPVGTDVYNKQGNRLCEVCLYFEDTPLLDNVMAISLNARNEETEIKMLRAACVIDTPRSFYDDPILPELKGLHDPATAPTLVDGLFNHSRTLRGDASAIQDRLFKFALPLAYAAFIRIMHVGRCYLPIMRLCSEFTVWDYMEGNAHALARLMAVQTLVQNGKY